MISFYRSMGRAALDAYSELGKSLCGIVMQLLPVPSTFCPHTVKRDAPSIGKCPSHREAHLSKTIHVTPASGAYRYRHGMKLPCQECGSAIDAALSTKASLGHPQVWMFSPDCYQLWTRTQSSPADRPLDATASRI